MSDLPTSPPPSPSPGRVPPFPAAPVPTEPPGPPTPLFPSVPGATYAYHYHQPIADLGELKELNMAALDELKALGPRLDALKTEVAADYKALHDKLDAALTGAADFEALKAGVEEVKNDLSAKVAGVEAIAAAEGAPDLPPPPPPPSEEPPPGEQPASPGAGEPTG